MSENTVTASTKTEDTSVPVRPALVNGQPFWNRNAIMFLYAPSFDFPTVENAVKYRFEIIDDIHNIKTFDADTPNAFLSPVWNEIPAGITTVSVFGISADEKIAGLAGRRTFWRKAGFCPGKYPPAVRSYNETAKLILGNVFSSKEALSLIAEEPQMLYYYPTKMLSSVIRAAARRISLNPETKAESELILRAGADYLIETSAPDNSPIAGFSITYRTDEKNPDWANTNMLIYPAISAQAYIDAWRATGDDKYLNAACKTADTYIRMQGDDGSWPLKVSIDSGKPLCLNRCMTTVHIDMFEQLFEATGEIKYREAGDRAFAYIENGPLSNWNWEGQYEDTPPTEPYMNLTIHDACSTGLYLLKRYPGDKEKLACARELLRFAEDQFLNWEKPFLNGRIIYPEKGKGFYDHYWDQEFWIMPSAFEQYGCFTPVDGSAAKLIATYIALYRAEHNEIDLQKACALADAITRMTDDDGLESTWWNTKEKRQGVWVNCMLYCETVLEELTELLDEIQNT